ERVLDEVHPYLVELAAHGEYPRQVAGYVDPDLHGLLAALGFQQGQRVGDACTDIDHLGCGSPVHEREALHRVDPVTDAGSGALDVVRQRTHRAIGRQPAQADVQGLTLDVL